MSNIVPVTYRVNSDYWRVLDSGAGVQKSVQFSGIGEKALRKVMLRNGGLRPYPTDDWAHAVGAEGVDVDRRRQKRPPGELGTGQETPASPQRDQLADPVAVSGHREGVAPLDGVHDLFGPHPQITLAYLALQTHVAQRSTE